MQSTYSSEKELAPMTLLNALNLTTQIKMESWNCQTELPSSQKMDTSTSVGRYSPEKYLSERFWRLILWVYLSSAYSVKSIVDKDKS